MFKELVELVKKERALVFSLIHAMSYIVLANIISVILDYPITTIYLVFIINLLTQILFHIKR